MGKKRIIKAHSDKAGQSVGVENLKVNNTITATSGTITKDSPTDKDVTVDAGYTLSHPNLIIGNGLTYTINGSLVV